MCGGEKPRKKEKKKRMDVIKLEKKEKKKLQLRNVITIFSQ